MHLTISIKTLQKLWELPHGSVTIKQDTSNLCMKAEYNWKQCGFPFRQFFYGHLQNQRCTTSVDIVEKEGHGLLYSHTDVNHVQPTRDLKIERFHQYFFSLML